MQTSDQWKGKVAIVTAGATGMGRDVCLALARRGVKLVIGQRQAQTGQTIVQEIQNLGGEAIFQVTDICKAQDCEVLVQRAIEQYGHLDLAFNNAGMQRDFSPIHATSIDDISQTIDTNLKGLLYLMKYQTEAMQKQGAGAIVNNASIFGLKAMPNTAEYIASKHGMIGATRAVALDYAQSNIRVNAICPGPIKTPSYNRVTGGDDHLYYAAVPMHRIGQVHEVTSAVLWLLSDQASYVTGSILSVDGGMSAQ